MISVRNFSYLTLKFKLSQNVTIYPFRPCTARRNKYLAGGASRT